VNQVWKLKADQWRTLVQPPPCFTHSSLGSGDDDTTLSGLQKALGCNPFLISASSCFISYYIGGEGGPIPSSHANYPNGLRSFSLNIDSPNQHMALHLENICDSMAVHSWWPFLSTLDRMLQRIPTNFRLVSFAYTSFDLFWFSQGKLERNYIHLVTRSCKPSCPYAERMVPRSNQELQWSFLQIFRPSSPQYPSHRDLSFSCSGGGR